MGKLKVFLCHAGENKSIVKRLYDRLVEAGYDPWLDSEVLLPGMDWDIEIKKALRASDAAIVCLSTFSVAKGSYLQKELRFAQDIQDEKTLGTIFSIPLRLDECKAPFDLQGVQWGDLNASNGFERLVRTLNIRARQIGKETGVLHSSYAGGPSFQNKGVVMSKYENTVFVSYAWGDESQRIVDELEQVFEQRGIRVTRDKKDLDYKGSPEGLEQRIARGQCIVLVINDNYLRSEHCMSELTEADENPPLRKLIFPIVLADAKIYKVLYRMVYIKYWDEKIEQLNQAIKGVRVLTNLSKLVADLDKYSRFRTSIDHLPDLLADMNTLTADRYAATGVSDLVDTVEQAMARKIDAVYPFTKTTTRDKETIEPHTAPSGDIFISYRRADSDDVAGRIYDRLVAHFGSALVFKDVDSIPLGYDFKQYIDKKVGECKVLLAIIGNQWLQVNAKTGKSRLRDPGDYVRLEIESALARDIPVIPVLVRGASIPPARQLPLRLKPLVYRNGIAVRPDPDFHRDMDRLISALEKHFL